MVTSRQIDLVQDSFAAVLPDVPTAAALFYARLFALAPELRVLFHTDMGDQGRKLFLTLATVVDALDRLEQVLPVARALAVRHVGYGAREVHYAVVGRALLDMLAATLGPRFDAETRVAWTVAYDLLSGCMIAAAREADADTMALG